jgi:hypothetical protein
VGDTSQSGVTATVSFMRGTIVTLYWTLFDLLGRVLHGVAVAVRLVVVNWQPITAIIGTLTAVTGITVTAARLTLWLTPQLGWAPAATVAGVLVTTCAVAWTRVTVVENQ